MKKLKIAYGDRPFVLPRDGVIDQLGAASEFHLKVLLLAAAEDSLRADYETGAQELCRRLDCTPSALRKAIDFWSKAGVLSLGEGSGEAAMTAAAAAAPAKLQASVLPAYTESQTAEVIRNAPELPDVINMCQQIIGKIFTPAEISIVAGLYDHLGVDGEYIATLFAYCRDNGKRSIRYIEKTAINLFDEGIDNTQALSAYIKRKEDFADSLNQLRKLLGTGSRELTTKEKKSFECWLDTWKFDIPVITRAFEITVDKIKEPNLSYMNKVLENWHNSGLHTLEAVEASLETYKKNKAEAEARASGFETDEFFEAALKRSYQKGE